MKTVLGVLAGIVVAVVCVFAKPPRAGEVKTRLAPAVGGGADAPERARVIGAIDAVAGERGRE